MKLLGIEFAPANVPLERRLQTAIVLHFCSTFVFGAFIILFISITLIRSDYYLFLLLYFAWIVYDRDICNQGGRRSEWVRSFKAWKYFKDYFPITLVKTAELDTKKNYMFCYHPHGVIAFGAFSCFGTNAAGFRDMFPGIVPHLLTLKMNFLIPFQRENILASGACAATKEGIEFLLSKAGKGHALVLVVGGAAESLLAHPNKAELVLKKRKGFVRLALKHGASLVPVFAFGENELYNQVDNPEGTRLRKFQNKFKDLFGFAPPIAYGRGIFQYTLGILPYRKPVHVVVGKPIDLEKIPEPTTEDVERAHKLYIEKLTELFEEHKGKYNPDLELKIV